MSRTEHVRIPLLKGFYNPLLCSPARFKRRVDLLGPLYCTLAFALFEWTFPLSDKEALGYGM